MMLFVEAADQLELERIKFQAAATANPAALLK
jgi:hypothetical protein